MSPPLLDHYMTLRNSHIGLVSASGALFAVRGLGVLAGATWPMAAWVRRLSVAIDVLLLAAGLTLWTMLGLNPAREHWLGTKLVLLLLYIVLCSLALKRGRTRRHKALFFVLALVLFGFMVTVALKHSPAGLLAA